MKVILNQILKKILNINLYRLIYIILRVSIFKRGNIYINGLHIKYNDGRAFFGMYNEIFVQKYYNIPSTKENPLIIDCGSNIGLSILYFHQIFPNAKIIGIEADINIVNILNQNLQRNNCKAEIIQKAVWCTDHEILNFGGIGADAGSLYANENIQKVKTIRLKTLLQQFEVIDFLKIDIEGAEIETLIDCQNELSKVVSLFVEYHSFPEKRQNLDILLKIITEAGFRYQIIPARKLSDPYSINYNEYFMDLQLNIFCYKPN